MSPTSIARRHQHEHSQILDRFGVVALLVIAVAIGIIDSRHMAVILIMPFALVMQSPSMDRRATFSVCRSGTSGN